MSQSVQEKIQVGDDLWLTPAEIEDLRQAMGAAEREIASGDPGVSWDEFKQQLHGS